MPEVKDRMGRTYIDVDEVKNSILSCQQSQHPQNLFIPQLTQPQYQFVHSDQPHQIKLGAYLTQTNQHTPSKTKGQTTVVKQGEGRLERKMGNNHIERREEKEK